MSITTAMDNALKIVVENEAKCDELCKIIPPLNEDRSPNVAHFLKWIELKREPQYMAAIEHLKHHDPYYMLLNGDYEKYRRSLEWKKLRKVILKRDDRTCFRCRGTASEVHHRSYEPEVMRGNDLSKLVSLCRKCHDFISKDECGQMRSSEEQERLLQTKPTPLGQPRGTRATVTDYERLTNLHRIDPKLRRAAQLITIQFLIDKNVPHTAYVIAHQIQKTNGECTIVVDAAEIELLISEFGKLHKNERVTARLIAELRPTRTNLNPTIGTARVTVSEKNHWLGLFNESGKLKIRGYYAKKPRIISRMILEMIPLGKG